MNKKLIFYPYNMGSKSCRELSTAFDTRKVFADGKYRYRKGHVVINWGNSQVPNWWNNSVVCLNHPKMVAIATNKLSTFRTLQRNNVPIPNFTTSIEEALGWIENKGIVVCRTKLTGHSGQGIVLARKPEEIKQAPLYTKHLRHKHEYRIHVLNRQVIDAVQKKKDREGVEETLIRSHDNGWVFCRQGVVIPKAVNDVALQAISALNLSFGAVDIAYREKENQAFVLEVNTAPGIEGVTVQRYVDAFRKLQNAL